MRKSVYPGLLILLGTVSMALSGTASADNANLSVNGKVMEKGTRTPIAGALISIGEAESMTAITDDGGNFRITFPQPGKYSVTASTFGDSQPVTKLLVLEADTPPPSLTFYLLAPAILPEVVVSAERNPNQVSKSVLKGEELRQLAGSSGDPLRSLQSLPGVAMSNNGGSAPAIRGSGPGENFYYADAIPVGKVFHFGGLSVFNGDLIENFNLYSAAFAPYYDNVTGAILDITLRNPRSDRLGGKVNISLTGADFLLEGPASENQSFYFAARRSYFDLLIRSIERKGVTLQIPNYWDYQGKYIWNINADNRLSAHMTGSADSLQANIASDSDLAKTQPDLAGAISSKDASATQALVWDSKLLFNINNKLVFGHRTGLTDASIGTAGRIHVVTQSRFIREKVVLPITDNHELTLSSNASNNTVGLDMDFKNTSCTQFNTGCDLSSAPRVQLNDTYITTLWDASAQERWRIVPSFTLIGGLRHSKDNYLNQSYTEPRVGMEWNWSEQTLLTAGWGRHNQQPPGQQIAPNFGNPQLSHIRAEHSVLGISHKPNIDWSWKAEAYYKKFSDLVVGVKDPAINYVNGASGAAYGTELLLKKEATEKLSGWLALTLSRSERRNDLTGESFRFEYDQPINATLISNYKISQEWSLGSKWAYTSGRPYTPIIGIRTYDGSRPLPEYAAINSGTLPDYHRLDLRIDRHLIYDTWKFNAYFELNNVYRRQNVVGYDYGPNYDKKEAIESLVIPISFGVQGEF
ncbi:MAG TPA: carboxypeptidase regulatory-like domain-containing protein [Gallionellaceae bacterium]|nr:carboxypeptidase regulatory-like domain-containing protein [Gallionellaceae bacterium]